MSKQRPAAGDFLKRVESQAELSPADLSLLGDLMVKGVLSKEEAGRLTKSKPVSRSEQPRIEALTPHGMRIIQTNTVIQSLDRGDVVGELFYQMVGDKRFGKVMFISDIQVEPELQDKGHGGDLMDHAERYARRAEKDAILLEIVPTNFGALRFFSRIGYHEAGRRKGKTQIVKHLQQ
jgi:ribosomal protein S18 acetylase RimI-like enzyme